MVSSKPELEPIVQALMDVLITKLDLKFQQLVRDTCLLILSAETAEQSKDHEQMARCADKLMEVFDTISNLAKENGIPFHIEEDQDGIKFYRRLDFEEIPESELMYNTLGSQVNLHAFSIMYSAALMSINAKKGGV